MTKNKTKKLNTSQKIFIIFLILIAITIGFFLTFPEKLSPIYSNLKVFYESNTWITFQSNRAKFSFQHPISWPIATPSEQDWKGRGDLTFNEVTVIDSLVFSNQFYWNAGTGDGYIEVEKMDGINNLDDFINSIMKDEYFYPHNNLKQKMLLPKPVLTYLTIGGEKAINIEDTPSQFGANLDPSSFKYVIVKNKLIYTIVLYYTQDKEKINTFKKIVNTFKFTN